MYFLHPDEKNSSIWGKMVICKFCKMSADKRVSTYLPMLTLSWHFDWHLPTSKPVSWYVNVPLSFCAIMWGGNNVHKCIWAMSRVVVYADTGRHRRLCSICLLYKWYAFYVYSLCWYLQTLSTMLSVVLSLLYMVDTVDTVDIDFFIVAIDIDNADTAHLSVYIHGRHCRHRRYRLLYIVATT